MLAKNKLYLKTTWAMDNSFRRHIQIAGKMAKSNIKKGNTPIAKSATVSHVILK